MVVFWRVELADRENPTGFSDQWKTGIDRRSSRAAIGRSGERR